MANPGGKWVTIREAVDILGVSDKTIRRKIKLGLLSTKKAGRSYLVLVQPQQKEEPIRDEPNPEPQQRDGEILSALINQLKEKDDQIRNLNERMRENNVLLMEFRRLLPAPKMDEAVQGETEIYETTTKRSTATKNVGKQILHGILGALSVVITISIVGFVAYKML